MVNKPKSDKNSIFRYVKYFLLRLKNTSNYRLIEKSQYFNKDWYTSVYHDINKKGIDPIVHYLVYGWKEGREPSDRFKTWTYLKKYPDVKKSNINPLLHYEKYGKNEGRNLTYGVNNETTTFFIALNIINQLKSSDFRGNIVLLVSHNLSLTGAPRALLNMAVELKKTGNIPIIAAFTRGAMEEEIEELGIPLLYINPNNVANGVSNSKKLFSFFNVFDYIVFNTVVTLELAEKIVGTSATKISWIHEAEFEFGKAEKRLNLNKAFKAVDYVYSVGEYSKKYTDKYLTNIKSELLLYSIKDEKTNSVENDNIEVDFYKKDKLIFTTIGALSERKGHEVLIDALKYIPSEILQNIEFWIIGPVGEKKVEKLVRNAETDYFRYLGTIEYERLISLMNDIDVILCPSLDDPMPMVATEGMMTKKAVLVTENTGTASLIDDGINGYIVEAGSAKALADKICEIYADRNNLKKIGENARAIYEKNFTPEHFSKEVSKIFNDDRKVIRTSKFIPKNNKIRLLDMEVSDDTITIIASSGILNETYVKYCDDIIYSNDIDFSISQKCFNEYLNESNEKLNVFHIKRNSKESKITFFDDNNEQVIIKAANYINLYHLSKQGICVITSGNELKLCSKFKFVVHNLLNSRYTIIEKLGLVKMMLPRKNKYNLYFETLNNHNDNAYELFLMDLKKNNNKNAYFVTSKAVYENEKDDYIKKHMIVLNSIKHKKYALRAKKMVVSWWCFPIFGEKKSDMYYPFLNYNYSIVLHGISYDKNSYYLNVYNFGKAIPTYCCSKYEKEYLEKINGYTDVKMLGYPRMDKWYNQYDIDENMIFLFPTWRKNITKEYIYNIVEICEKITEEFSEIKIIYAAHPSIPDKHYKQIKQLIKRISGNIVVVSSMDGDDFNKYFSQAKYLITDYSSVAYDHAYKKDGISIYYLSNIKDNDHYQLRDIFYEGHCGIVAESIDDIKEIIRNNYNYNNLNKRKKNFFCYIDNNNTQRVFNDIFKDN